MFSRYLKSALAILRSNRERLPQPYKLTLALTYRCNLRCQSCLTWKRPTVGEMTLGEIRRFFQRQSHFSWVDLTGGETTLRPDLCDIIETVVENSPQLILLHFPTNGFLPEKALRAARAGSGRLGLKRVITVSVDGPPNIHNRLKGTKGSWERALETFAALRREKGIEVFLGMTLQRDNIELRRQTLAAVRERLPDIQPRDFHYNLAHRSFFYDNLELDPVPDPDVALSELKNLLAGYRPLPGPRRFLERAYLKGAVKFVAQGTSPLPCLAGSSSCFIDPQWNVYPCTGYDRRLGNLRETDFDLGRIWNDPGTVSLQKEIISGHCPQCWTPCEAYQTILGNLFSRRRPGGVESGA
jgi:MoaA/NifB/PqqE/SkfB family radical SAM enzyme